MSVEFSEQTHRNMIDRIPRATGRELSDWLRTVDEGPSLVRPWERVSWLRGAYELSYGQAKAIVHEYHLRRAARRFG
ncbi:DUF4287 domain-containing protein [Streptomyces sp. NPDC051567]|uniref:DUF4287 domain-containing protein n=1 Tax=Streptomyces sp. NPDC051567 TaxID=3365660 RepID=UPI00379698EB